MESLMLLVVSTIFSLNEFITEIQGKATLICLYYFKLRERICDEYQCRINVLTYYILPPSC